MVQRVRASVVYNRAIVLGLGLLCGCEPTATRPDRPLPVLASLQFSYAIPPFPDASVSDVLGLPQCKVLVAGSNGALGIVDSLHGTTIVGHIPDQLMISLSGSSEAGLLVVSEAPSPFLARVSLDPFALDSMPIPEHPWGRVWVGPVLPFGNALLSAPLLSPTTPRRSFSSLDSVRLLELVGQDGRVIRTAGPSIPHTDGYASWRHSTRGAFGLVQDTVYSVSFHSGRVMRTSLSDGESHPAYELVRYFVAARPRIEVLRFPWIQFGEFPYFFDTPQVYTASFSAKGSLYAVRPYKYEWQTRHNPYVRRSGYWAPTATALEVYTPDGQLAGAFDVPIGVEGVKPDEFGRLFLLVDGQVLVYEDPLSTGAACATE